MYVEAIAVDADEDLENRPKTIRISAPILNIDSDGQGLRISSQEFEETRRGKGAAVATTIRRDVSLHFSKSELQMIVDNAVESNLVSFPSAAPLTEWDEFLAVKALVGQRLTQTEIAEKLAKEWPGRRPLPQREWVQPRVELARMPQFVRVEMQKFVEKRKAGGAKPGELRSAKQ